MIAGLNQHTKHISHPSPTGESEGGSIALFGGTFDPIHNAHIALAEACKEQLGLDEVWFLVTPQNPWKQGSTLSPDAMRLRMAQLAVEGHEGLVASDYEFHLDKPTYTYLTLRHLREDYPQHQFTLLIGGDNWAKFDHWAHYEEIVEHHRIAVYPRNLPQPLQGRGEANNSSTFDNTLSNTPHGSIPLPSEGLGEVYIQSPLLPISSTSIRQLVAEHKDISHLVPPAVEQYITEHHLYT